MASEQPKEEDSGEANDSVDLNVQLMGRNVRSPVDGENVRTVNEHMISGDNGSQIIDLNVQLMDTNVGYPVDGENLRTDSDYYNQSIDLNVLPTVNASPGQNFAGSFRSSIGNSVCGFPDMQKFRNFLEFGKCLLNFELRNNQGQEEIPIPVANGFDDERPMQSTHISHEEHDNDETITTSAINGQPPCEKMKQVISWL